MPSLPAAEKTKNPASLSSDIKIRIPFVIGLNLDQAKRLKELEAENARLKKLVAEAELDKAILREAASGNF